MSYYYANNGGNTGNTGTWGPVSPDSNPTPTTQVGLASNETIYNTNINSSIYFDSNFAFQFNFNVSPGPAVNDADVRRKDVTKARIYIYQNISNILTQAYSEITNNSSASLVGYVDIIYSTYPDITNVNSDNGFYGYGGYGTTKCKFSQIGGTWKLSVITPLNATTPSTYTKDITWVNTSNGFLPGTRYIFKVWDEPKGTQFNPSAFSSSSSDNYGFGVLNTLNGVPPTPVSFKPLVFNVNATDINLVGSVVNVKLNGSYKYTTTTLQVVVAGIQFSADSPIEAGFAYREQGISNWTYVSALTIAPSFTVSTTSTYFSKVVTGLIMGKDYEYTSWVLIQTNDKYFSRLASTPITTISTNLISNAVKIPFVTPTLSVTSWITPNTGTTWYQIYDDWKLVESSSSSSYPKNRIFPFFQVRNYSTSSSSILHDDITKEYPLAYYFNKNFNKDKTYKFKTIVENFYNGQPAPVIPNVQSQSSDCLLSNFKLNVPWGESYNYSNVVPYFPFPINNIPDSLKLINLYLYTNINSFDSSVISKQKPIDNFSSTNNPKNPIYYSANAYFNYRPVVNTSSSLLDVDITEIDWETQGFAPFDIMNNGGLTYIGAQFNVNNSGEFIPVYIAGEPMGGKGWHFLDKKGEFIWFDKYNHTDLVENSKNLPIGGDSDNYYYNKTSHHKYLQNNYITKFVAYQTFNMSFDYKNESDFRLKMYVGDTLPKFESDKYDLKQLILDGYVKEIATLGKSLGTKQSCEFVGLSGNKYVFFIADPVYTHIDNSDILITTIPTYYSSINNLQLTSTTYSVISLSNFKISGAYNDLNNDNFDVKTLSSFEFKGLYSLTTKYYLNDVVVTSTGISMVCITTSSLDDLFMDNFDFYTSSSVPKLSTYSTTTPISNAAYSMKLGFGNNVVTGDVFDVFDVYSQAGNGRFNSGIWENGVWNSGWREDLTRKDFYKIDQFYSYEKDKKWRVRISGPLSSIVEPISDENFFKIGDKVSISNIIAIDINEERKLLKKYYTIIDIGSNYIEVEFENDFPLRRIEMDSDEHRIYVSKNVWLSGVFLNGYFKGIWNSGLFSGYPLITKMDESHWIDGIFNGGHFTANKYGSSFSMCFQAKVDGVTRLGLSFSTPHKLTIDDIISINPEPYTYNLNTYNNSLGTTVVTDVIDEYRLATGINWKSEYISISNGGKIYSIISTGLIQNFDFYSNNVSTVTSLQSLKSERVFSYNSWIDVNYSNQSAVNIGKPQSILEGDTKRSYSENNLYGYPTNDILSSNSVFRDSFSTSFRKYKLGKKWKIFNDYVGDSSSFEEYFDSSDTTAGLEAFNTQGWDISVNTDNDIKLVAQSIDYPIIRGIEGMAPLNPPAQIASTSSMTMSFYNDIRNIISSNVIVDSVIIDRIWHIDTGLNIKTSKYTSNAIVKNINYNSITNITSVLLENNIVVSKLTQVISPPIINSYISSYLDKAAKSYLTVTINSGLTFSRTPEPLNSNSLTIGKELKVNTTNKGGYLNLIPAYDVTNRTNGTDTITIEKIRYSLVEFDIVDHISATTSYIEPSTGYKQPSIHFNNLNYTTRNVLVNSVTQSFIFPATYLPINKNVNHLLTRSKKKQEFFFNKRNLLMNFKGTGLAGNLETEYYLDNIKFYQVNMIPFFQYFISPIGVQGNINKSVQIPNNGVSPIIDYTENNIIDANNDNNDIITFFSNNLITSNIEIPAGINWQRDYSIYKTQISGNDILGSDDPYITI